MKLASFCFARKCFLRNEEADEEKRVKLERATRFFLKREIGKNKQEVRDEGLVLR